MSLNPLRKHPRILMALLLVAAVCAGALLQRGGAIGQEPVKEVNPEALRHAHLLSQAFNDAAEIALPSVVTVYSKTKSTPVARNRTRVPGGGPNGENPLKGTPFEHFFDGENGQQMPQAPRQGMGSGVIIDRSGIVLTNNHVVEGADEVIVHLADGREFKAEDIKTDPQTDLAVLRIKDAGTLPAARMGNSDNLKIGDWVIAIGNPFELEQTVSAGIISGMGRDLATRSRDIRTRFLQTDAAINPGNSGGPLVNLHGEVIGINTAIATNTGSYSGIGFAVPGNVAKWVTDQLINKGSVARAYLGVNIRPLTPELAAAFGTRPGKGALVTDVLPGAPAAEAGIKPGDVVTKFANQQVIGPAELQSLVERMPIDSKQPIEVQRDGKAMQLTVVPKAFPSSILLASRRGPSDEPAAEEPQAFDASDLGLQVADLTAEKAEELKMKPNEGVLVVGVDPNSPAFEHGVREGMVVLRVGKKDVKSVDEFKAALKDETLAKGILLYVQARNGKDFVLLKE